MKLGIDASNITSGGGLTHLIELLDCVNPSKFGFSQVVVWSSSKVLSKINKYEWLELVSDSLLDGGLLRRVYWQKNILKKYISTYECDLLFVPGGRVGGHSIPVVSVCQNLLPFEWKELLRYGISFITVRLILLRFLQLQSFKRSDGVIFLSEYSKNTVLNISGKLRAMMTIVPHGINSRFFIEPRISRDFVEFTEKNPCKVTYVSIIDQYKHQDNVILAISKLRDRGIFVEINLVGPSYPPARERLEKMIVKLDPSNEYIKYSGAVDYDSIHDIYSSSDIAIFASSCETFGMILTEAMAAGLPIACSNRSSMPELLGSSGVYFDPLYIDDMEKTLDTLIYSKDLRNKLSHSAYQQAKKFSWSRCSDDTFEFLEQVANNNR